MKSNFDALRLKQLLKDFYAVVGIRISVFDDRFDLVAEYPEEPPEFCAIIRRQKAGLEACTRCDRAAFMRTRQSGEASIYICHAGLTEAITPIQLDNYIVGYAIFAHMMPRENYRKSLENIIERSQKYFDSREELLEAVKEIPTHPTSTINSSIRLLEAIAAFLQLHKITSRSDTDIAHQLDRFIKNNLSDDLSCKVLCRHFLISRTKLYLLSTQNFGTGITQYITSLRIEKAAAMLKESNDSVKDIAGKVGISDYNYFSKIFKKAKGLPPGKFRRC